MKIPTPIPEGKIFLVGMPGSGKTTIGKTIAEKNNRPFFDLDTIIETQTQKTITEIFAEQGEPDFRKTETETLRNYVFPDDAIIAMGGGTPCFYDNIKWMKNQGTVIYLQASLEAITKRIQSEDNSRPLFKNKTGEKLKDAVAGLLMQRKKVYAQADLVWDV